MWSQPWSRSVATRIRKVDHGRSRGGDVGKGEPILDGTPNYMELCAAAFSGSFLVLDETRAADEFGGGQECGSSGWSCASPPPGQGGMTDLFARRCV